MAASASVVIRIANAALFFIVNTIIIKWLSLVGE
jgi:hypothetical protein